MIDFTGCEQTLLRYGGANGFKIGVVYDGEDYLLKFPGRAKLTDSMSYTNGSVSEYIACHIYNLAGVPAQDTVLGVYKKDSGIYQPVVACKDFTDPKVGLILQDFASLKNSVVDSERHGYGANLNDILETIDRQSALPADEMRDRFWNMFVIDELIANPDRHNGNWGILCNLNTRECTLAPVYDCGSSLLPQASEKSIDAVLSSRSELNIRVYERPTSALTLDNGKRINYNSFNQDHMQDYPDYARALDRMERKLNMVEIGKIIDNTPGITDKQKEFYKTLITARKQLLLDKALDRATDLGIVQQGVLDDRSIPGTHDYTQSLERLSDEQNVVAEKEIAHNADCSFDTR